MKNDNIIESTEFKVEMIRKDFPLLTTTVHGKPLVYLDNAATSQKPWDVIKAIENYYAHQNSNIHRGVHYLSQLATEAYEESRKKVAQFINTAHNHEVIFTKGTTDGINLVASSFGRKFIHSGDIIMISTMEHHSNIVPWQLLSEYSGASLSVIPINEKGELLLDQFKSMLNKKVKLVCIAYVSNTLGTVNPVKKIIEISHQYNIPVLIDAAQAIQHLPIDVQELDCDFLVFSGHKMYGPTGIGVLYGKEKWLEDMPPYQGGGDMIKTVSFDKTTYNELPFKFEAGTPNIEAGICLANAIAYIKNIGFDQIHRHEHELLEYATDELLKIAGLKIIGTAAHKASVISFIVDNIHPYDIGLILDKLGIAVRTGHHCTQPLMDFYGIAGTVRASFAFYNTKEEVDQLVSGVKKAVRMLS
ncbi:aminotransferase class V-fold PLP-dependent enzyme [Solitalea koreensis]|nr:cysteine desulfurase [Solitalea koreensis]